jgi:hypothetical protein
MIRLGIHRNSITRILREVGITAEQLEGYTRTLRRERKAAA